jgi:uncharacterized membrane-anchored protein YhcB (DUF1043 family)
MWIYTAIVLFIGFCGYLIVRGGNQKPMQGD